MGKNKLLFVGCFVLLLISLTNEVYGQFTTGDAVAISIDGDIPNGSIISNFESSYQLSTTEYDPTLFGVTSDSPSAYIDDATIENKHLIVTHGEVFLRVTNKNGSITEGDFLTSSDIPGVAQKATQTGQIIGSALDSFDQSEGTILAFVEIRTQYIASDAQNNIITTLKNAVNTPFISPIVSLRYLLAALLILFSLMLGFFNFRRISGSSIEALGRNPLAQKTIRSSVLLNVVITFSIMLTGIVLAIFILIL